MDNEDYVSEATSYESAKESYNMEMFLSDHLDTLLDLFDDIKERFAFNPLFLGRLKPTEFVDYMIESAYALYDTRVDENYYNSHRNDFETFVNEYTKEMKITYTELDNFLEAYDCYAIDFESFSQFCFRYSLT